MDYGILIAGIGIGLIIGSFAMHITRRLERKLIAELRHNEAADAHLTAYLTTRLTNLRANAFLTNEHGHRVRYSKASAEVRARAEAE